MNTIRIDIINPKAMKLIEDMADLNLIAIMEDTETDVLLARLRSKSASAPSLEEITKEVEEVRTKRYAK